MELVDERISLDQWMPPWIRYQHIARYEWVLAFVRGRTVVEAACGTGYGSEIILKGGARRVDCFDVSEEAIHTARKRYNAEGLHFETADVTRLPVTDHSCDVFVSLETIEHIDDDRGFLAEVRRVLKPGGTFICSTPNRALTNPGTSINDHPFNPYHVREYTLNELESLLHLYFNRCDLYYQSRYSLSYGKLLGGVGRRFPRLAVRLHQARKLLGIPWENLEKHIPSSLPVNGEPEILVAVCTG